MQLGPETIDCPSCGTIIHTGRKEWPQLSPDEKRSFLLRGTWIILFFVLFLLLLAPAIGAGLLIVLYLFLGCAAFPSLIVVSRLIQAWQSAQRYAEAKTATIRR